MRKATLKAGSKVVRWNLEWNEKGYKDSGTAGGVFFWASHWDIQYGMALDVFSVESDIPLLVLTNEKRSSEAKVMFFSSLWVPTSQPLRIEDSLKLQESLRKRNVAGFFSTNNENGSYEVFIIPPFVEQLKFDKRVLLPTANEWSVYPHINWHVDSVIITGG